LAGRDSSQWPSNILIDRCAFDQNNGTGLALCTVRNVSVVNCSMSENGNRGGGGHCVRDLLVADTQFNDNGWRFGPWLVGHDMAGFKLFDGADSDRWFVARSYGVRFLRCTFRGNRCHNLWQDYGPTGSVIESCLFEDSPHTAVFQEVTPGGLRVKDCVIRRLRPRRRCRACCVVASPDVTLSGCTIYDCGSEKMKYCTLVSMIGDKRAVSPKMENAVHRLRIENCVLQATRANSYLFRCSSWNGADVPRKDFAETAELERQHLLLRRPATRGRGRLQDGEELVLPKNVLQRQ
jgi:hypothetical protein